MRYWVTCLPPGSGCDLWSGSLVCLQAPAVTCDLGHLSASRLRLWSVIWVTCLPPGSGCDLWSGTLHFIIHVLMTGWPKLKHHLHRQFTSWFSCGDSMCFRFSLFNGFLTLYSQSPATISYLVNWTQFKKLRRDKAIEYEKPHLSSQNSSFFTYVMKIPHHFMNFINFSEIYLGNYICMWSF